MVCLHEQANAKEDYTVFCICLTKTEDGEYVPVLNVVLISTLILIFMFVSV